MEAKTTETKTPETKTTGTIISQVKTEFERIKALLLENEEYRDCDDSLRARMWWDDLKALRPDDSPVMTAKDLLLLMKQKRLSNPESIRRARQKVQELHPETRGKKYRSRHKADNEFTVEINNVG